MLQSSGNVPVIILNWNGWDDTFNCLRSLRNIREIINVWLVDNSSVIDRSLEARNICSDLRILRLDDNYGWSGGCNRALKIAAKEGYEYAYLLNNDCEVAQGFLSAAHVMMLNDERMAAVGSQIAYKEPGGYVKYDGDYHSPGSRPLHQFTGGRLVNTVNGAGMLIRLRVMEKEGYFDERFFCYHEETEWCWRVTKNGWLCGVSYESLVVHKGEGSDVNANAFYYRARNSFLLLKEQRVAFHETVGIRKKSQLIDKIVLCGMEAQRHGNTQGWTAVASGLYDGLRNKFGRRAGGRILIAKIFIILWYASIIIRNRLQRPKEVVA